MERFLGVILWMWVIGLSMLAGIALNDIHDSLAAGNGHDPVTICHLTGSENHPWQEITVDDDAVPAHLEHGDFVVDEEHICPPTATATPTDSPTATPTATATAVLTETPTTTATASPPASPTDTPTPTATSTPTPSVTATPTAIATTILPISPALTPMSTVTAETTPQASPTTITLSHLPLTFPDTGGRK